MKRRNFKIRFWLGLAIAGVALGLPAVAQATTNVVPNSGFEQGGCGSTPVICGWVGYGLMSQDTANPHSGSASMSLGCGNTGCYSSGGGAGLSASTDPAFCAAIGPGTHPASFWYRAGPEVTVWLDATFFQAPDCTGSASGDFFSDWAIGDDAWHEVTGDLDAPPGTESALFDIGFWSQACDDFCGIWAGFDDLNVEDAVVPDATPPETTITSGPSGTTSSSSATFEFIANEPSTFECSLDTAPFAACSSPAFYRGLGEGSHTFRARATDTAGNTDPTPAEQSWTVDTTPPETTITSGPSGTTSSSSATFEFAANEPATFECSLDTAPFAACSSPASYTGLGDGSHTFRVRATDAAGNTDPTPAERSWVVQANTPPVARFTFSCSALTCSFDGSGSDGSIVSYAWDFGDGASESGVTVSHTYGRASSYTVTLTVTDDRGATASDSKAVNPISLSARGYKLNGLQKADLTWTGPSGTSFAIYRNGVRIATLQATSYTDNINKRGSGIYTYQVCAPTTDSCSNEAIVSF
jgi:hypothetical protein